MIQSSINSLFNPDSWHSLIGLIILLPIVMVLLTVALQAFAAPKIIKSVAISGSIFNLLLILLLGHLLLHHGSFSHLLGGWGAPLGIELHIDGLSYLFLLMTAIVHLAVSIYSSAYFKTDQAQAFWPLNLLLLTALNALYASADIFNLYVTLELIALSAVSLTALKANQDAIKAAMRYLLITLLGSLLYLLGISLLYHQFGSVDIHTLSQLMTVTNRLSDLAIIAFSLIAAGLIMKAALYPMHFWLPPAHSNAAAPVSALLSALVVKAAFYIFLRIWLNLYANHTEMATHLTGFLGAAAVLWGSYCALRQSRLKLLVAYSTVAQIGYLFLGFTLAQSSQNAEQSALIWSAVIYLAISHAFAKSAMFLAAGNLLQYGNHDRIKDLDRVVQRLPITAAAFALGGVSIMGLPPSGGFIGKWLLLNSAIELQRWDLVVIILLGSLLAAAYIFKVLGHAFSTAGQGHEAIHVPMAMQWSALLLAVLAIILGFTAPQLLPILDIGSVFTTGMAKVSGT